MSDITARIAEIKEHIPIAKEGMGECEMCVIDALGGHACTVCRVFDEDIPWLIEQIEQTIKQ